MKVSGSLSFRMFQMQRELPPNIIDLFAARAMPDISTLSDSPIGGWVTGRHMLDRNITDDTAMFGGYLRLALAQAERKVDANLLKAECQMEEQAQMQASGNERIGVATRREIRRSVEARLTPQAQPKIKGIPFVYDARNRMIYAGAISDRQVDALQLLMTQTIGFTPNPLTPEIAAMRLCGINVNDWEPQSFSEGVDDNDVLHNAGCDFLTWLWYVGEARGARITTSDGSQVDLMLEGPILFHGEGSGAHDVSIRRGEPLMAAETKAALCAGKKPFSAKLTLAAGDKMWTCTFHAPTFAIRSLRLPAGEKLDAVSMFQERMDSLDQFQRMLLGIYEVFCHERDTIQTWDAIYAKMRSWVADRRVRS